MIRRISSFSIALLLLVLFFSWSLQVKAQQSGAVHVFDDADTMALHESMRPSPEDVQMTDGEQQAVRDSLIKVGIAFMRLKEVIAMKKDILWNTGLVETIKGFEDSTYIMVEPLVKVQGRGALIGLVSLLGQIVIGNTMDPYVKVYWVITPVTEQGESFELSVELDYSDNLPDSIITAARDSMSRYYLNKVYQHVSDSQIDILLAMNAFLFTLGSEAGERFAPKYLLHIDGVNYRSGYQLSLFEQYESDDSIMKIHLVDRVTNEKIEDSITWTGATNEIYGHVEISKNTQQVYTVVATKNNLHYQITVTIMGDDVLVVVLGGMRSLLDEALIDVMQLLVDSAAAKEADYQNKREISAAMRRQMINKIESASGSVESRNASMFYSMDSTQVVSEPITVPIRTNTFMGQYINKAQLEHFARMAFIFAWENRKTLVAMTDPSNREAFIQEIIDDIGRLAANMIVQYASGDEEEMKAFLVQFIIEKVTMATQSRLSAQ